MSTSPGPLIVHHVAKILHHVNNITATTTPSSRRHIPQPVADQVYPALTIIVFIIGIIGNFLILYLMYKTKYSRYSFALYLRVLAVVDSLQLSSTLSMVISDFYYVDNDIQQTSPAVCYIIAYIDGVSTLSSSWLLLCLSLDCCISIVSAVNRKVFCTKRTACITIAFVMTLSAVVAVPEIVYLKEGFDDNILCNSKEVVYTLCKDIILVLIIPTSGIVLCTVAIFRTVHKNTKTLEQELGSGPQGEISQEWELGWDYSSINTAPIRKPLVLVALISVCVLPPAYAVELTQAIVGENNPSTALQDVYEAFDLLRLSFYGIKFYILVACGLEYRRVLRASVYALFGKYVDDDREDETTELVPTA